VCDSTKDTYPVKETILEFVLLLISAYI